MEISFKFPNSLQNLNIENCPILFAEEGVPTSLTELYVREGCKIYKSLIEGGLHNLTSLRQLWVSGCEDSEPISQEGRGTTSSLPSLSTLGLQSLTSLKQLAINKFPELKTIPDLGSLISLESLWIKKGPKLKFVSDLGSLTSLQYLFIEECPKLKSVPDLGSLTSLHSLSIEECRKLKSWQLKRRWKRGRGKYCSKIAHISKVEIDGKLIFNSKEEE